MVKLPADRDELRNRWKAGESFRFYFFYGHKAPSTGVDSSCFSQWFARPFTVDDIEYPTAEHWMMAEKARLFEDDEMLAEILNCSSPKEAKAYGRKVRGFEQDVWSEHKFDIVVRGNLAKFGQHEDLKQFLLGTIEGPPDQDGSGLAGYDRSDKSSNDQVKERIAVYQTDLKNDESPMLTDVILVEAAGRDTIWGIGLGKANPKAQDPHTWRGLNLLGFALNKVRDKLALATS